MLSTIFVVGIFWLIIKLNGDISDGENLPPDDDPPDPHDPTIYGKGNYNGKI